MYQESGFHIAPDWPEMEKMAIAAQFADITSLSHFLALFCFSCQV